MVDLDDVVILRVGQVADAPLKALRCVLSHEDRIVGRGLKQVLLRVKPFTLISDIVLPCGLSELARALPLAKQDLSASLIALLNELSLIWEEVVELAAPVGHDLIHGGLSWFCAWCGRNHSLKIFLI